MDTQKIFTKKLKRFFDSAGASGDGYAYKTLNRWEILELHAGHIEPIAPASATEGTGSAW